MSSPASLLKGADFAERNAIWGLSSSAAWDVDVLAGAPATFLVHKVTLSMKVSARTVDQKRKGNLVPKATELSWVPWAPYFNLFYVKKK